MTNEMVTFQIEQSPLGRVYVGSSMPAGFAVFYTTRDFPGILDDASVQAIRRFLRDRFQIDAALWTCNQVHGTVVREVKRLAGSGFTECDQCDALWTDQPGQALGIKVADCLPVSLIDPQQKVLANIHSGWRGAASGITARTLDRLQESSQFSAARAQAFLGPSIRSCCFEVGEEVVERFAGDFREIERHADRSRGGRPFLDLIGITTEVLVRAGVARDAIHDSGLCTRCGHDFHSYRRDPGRTGRNLAIVAR
jgi:YfiH family protein